MTNQERKLRRHISARTDQYIIGVQHASKVLGGSLHPSAEVGYRGGYFSGYWDAANQAVTALKRIAAIRNAAHPQGAAGKATDMWKEAERALQMLEGV